VPQWYLPRVTEPDELRASRARLSDAAVADRRRIERALHDGVQQDLIATSVRLQLLRELLGSDPPAALDLLDELQRDTRDALDRVRSLAGEIYPALLDARGLPDAIREAARGSGTPARVETSGLQRHPAAIEAAVYFFCRAVLERAEPAAELAISLSEHGGELRLEIAGLAGLDVSPARDVVEAAGGVVLAADDAHVVVTLPV
jgi:signal transduction histidine kinase